MADLCEAYYPNPQGNEVPVFELPLDKIGNITGAPFAPDSADPLMQALKVFSRSNRQPEQAELVLRSFYKNFWLGSL